MSFVNEIENKQNEFYKNTNKNFLFKKTQKQECAKYICNNINLDVLLNNTFMQIPNTNKIYFNYLLFKTFANPENYNLCLNYIINVISNCISIYGNYEMHINIKSFTVSAMERYKSVIIKYLEMLGTDTTFSEQLVTIFVYNIPHVFDIIKQMVRPFISKIVHEKIKIIPPEISDSEIEKLHILKK